MTMLVVMPAAAKLLLLLTTTVAGRLLPRHLLLWRIASHRRRPAVLPRVGCWSLQLEPPAAVGQFFERATLRRSRKLEQLRAPRSFAVTNL